MRKIIFLLIPFFIISSLNSCELASGNDSPDKKTYTLTVDSNYDGLENSISVDPDLPEYEEGAVVTVTAGSIEGYNWLNWAGDASGTDGQVTITMNSDMLIEARYEKMYKLTITPSSSPTGDPWMLDIMVCDINPRKTWYDPGETVTYPASCPVTGYTSTMAQGANPYCVYNSGTGFYELTLNQDHSFTRTIDKAGWSGPRTINVSFSTDW